MTVGPARILLFAGAFALPAGGVSAQVPELPSDSIELRVMTFNIRSSAIDVGWNAWAMRKELVAETISEADPDVLGLQEALGEQISFLEDALPGYRWFGVDRGLNGNSGLSEATPIFYKYDVVVPIESGTFWLGNMPNGQYGGRGGVDAPGANDGRGPGDGLGADNGGPNGARNDDDRRGSDGGRGNDGRGGGGRGGSRIVTWARFHHFETGRQIWVYNTHFSPREGPQHVEAVGRILERVATLPPSSSVVVMGDFNSTAGFTEAWRVATSRGLSDAWQVADRRRGPPVTSNGFGPPPSGEDWRIDWILVGGPIQVPIVSTVVHSSEGRYPSDHYPVLATIRVGPT